MLTPLPIRQIQRLDGSFNRRWAARMGEGAQDVLINGTGVGSLGFLSATNIAPLLTGATREFGDIFGKAQSCQLQALDLGKIGEQCGRQVIQR